MAYICYESQTTTKLMICSIHVNKNSNDFNLMLDFDKMDFDIASKNQYLYHDIYLIRIHFCWGKGLRDFLTLLKTLHFKRKQSTACA